MRSLGPADGIRERVTVALGMILGVTSAIVLAMFWPEIERSLPDPIRVRRVGMVLVVLMSAYAIARRVRARPIARVDALSDWLNSRGLTLAIAGCCVAFLATWVPHYLLWPWARDADTFATLAQSWDLGIRPYRDIRGYNFPGAIYLSWILGKVFGWGRTWPLYAVDALALIVLGVVLSAWSRRCFGRRLPGLVSYYACLMYYLNHDFETVAQRDWHVALCLAIGLMMLEAWPGRASRSGSAMLAAAAIATRPHAILFLPALAMAVQERSLPREDGDPDGKPTSARALTEWSAFTLAFTVMAFSPIIAQGLIDDLWRGLRIAAYGGPYSRNDWTTAAKTLAEQLEQTGPALAIASLVVLGTVTRGPARRRVVTWSLALAAALGYRLLHPVQHRYLSHPMAMVGSIALALPIAWIGDRSRVSPFFRVALIVAILAEIGPRVPRFCDPSETLRAIATIARGQDLPEHAPIGAGGWFDPEKGRWYPWKDYHDTLIYLRSATTPSEPVANVLREPPFPAINGPAGRISPFRAESGICWMWLVPVDLEPEFADVLERAADIVVVWSPDEHRLISQLRLDRMAAVIRRDYRREARFGRIEVWRRARPPH